MFFWLDGCDFGGRQFVDAADEGGEGPELVITVRVAVGRHACHADTVFDDPINFGLGIFRADVRQLRDRRVVRVIFRERLAWIAVTAHTSHHV